MASMVSGSAADVDYVCEAGLSTLASLFQSASHDTLAKVSYVHVTCSCAQVLILSDQIALFPWPVGLA